MRVILTSIFLLLATLQGLASEKLPNKKIEWPFDGIVGKFDRQAIQRGFQVYKEVCAACHGMNNLYYRNLKNVGFSDEEIKAIAKEYDVTDGPNEDGEMFQRPAIPSDRFVNPYPNEEAARASNNSAFPVDLSLIIKARHDGANYVYSLLTGYEEKIPSDIMLDTAMSYNPYFPGKQISMPAPLYADQVSYIDGTNATVEHMAYDTVQFLQWASEPEMEHRKSLGLKVIFFLIIFSILFYIAKKRIWADVKK